jgi:cation/acetate symporter
MVVVSLITSAPNAATQKMVDNVRIPQGKSII